MGQKKSKKLKVCIISHFGFPLYSMQDEELFGGGAAVQLYNLTEEFVKDRSLEISIMTGEFNSSVGKFEIIRNIKFYKVLPIERSVYNYFRGGIAFFRYLRKIKPDIVIKRAADKKVGLAALYCMLFRKKFIYSIANQKDVDGRSEKGFFGKFFKFGINHASFIVAQQTQQIVDLKKYKNRKIRNITLIKSGYDIKKVNIKDKDYILWVGRGSTNKRPDLFVKLAKRFPKRQFVMVCNNNADDAFWRKVHKKAEKVPNLQFLEFVPFHEIDKYFQDAKIFVNTSIHEGFPNTFLQALKNNRPLISLNVNPDGAITENKIGLFCHNNFNEMEENLRLLLEDQELFNSVSSNTFEYVKENHHIFKVSQDWINLMKVLINHKN